MFGEWYKCHAHEPRRAISNPPAPWLRRTARRRRMQGIQGLALDVGSGLPCAHACKGSAFLSTSACMRVRCACAAATKRPRHAAEGYERGTSPRPQNEVPREVPMRYLPSSQRGHNEVTTSSQRGRDEVPPRWDLVGTSLGPRRPQRGTSLVPRRGGPYPTVWAEGAGLYISQTRYRGNNHEELETLALRLPQQPSVGGAPRVTVSRRSPLRLPAVLVLPGPAPGQGRVMDVAKGLRANITSWSRGSGSDGGGWKASPTPSRRVQAPQSREIPHSSDEHSK